MHRPLTSIERIVMTFWFDELVDGESDLDPDYVRAVCQACYAHAYAVVNSLSPPCSFTPDVPPSTALPLAEPATPQPPFVQAVTWLLEAYSDATSLCGRAMLLTDTGVRPVIVPPWRLLLAWLRNRLYVTEDPQERWVVWHALQQTSDLMGNADPEPQRWERRPCL
jgi:hypothetical protein